MTHARLKALVLQLVDYNWSDELRDYEEWITGDGAECDPNDHIFSTMRELAEYFDAEEADNGQDHKAATRGPA